jgi:molecular chaperone GrpE (heat shock protein)
MTDNEIIKAMEKFRCVNCNGDCAKESYEDLDCPLNLVKFSRDLINRQKSEIERLENSLSTFKSCYESLTDMYENAKSEAIKEFAEKLKNCFCVSKEYLDIMNIIDNLVKEMEGK